MSERFFDGELPTVPQVQDGRIPLYFGDNIPRKEDVPTEQEADRDVYIIPYIAKENPKGAAVIVFPGGGYSHISKSGMEGIEIGRALNERGITAFEVHYRYAPFDFRATLTDAQRAMRFVRYYAESFGIDPAKVAVTGFSAGGHLVTALSEHFDEDYTDAAYQKDVIDGLSARPAATVPGYAVLRFQDGEGGSTKWNFLGRFSEDLRLHSHFDGVAAIREDMPPVFLWHFLTDKTVPYHHSEELYAALCERGIPCEFHLYAEGAHGKGLQKGYPETAEWLPLAVEFLRRYAFDR